MKQLRLTFVVSAVLTGAGIAEAAKPAPPPPPPPPATGTIYYTDESGFWGMNADGSGKTQVGVTVPGGSRLAKLNLDPVYVWGLPCDQVYGGDSRRDRWFLWMAPTHRFDRIIRPDGTDYNTDNEAAMWHSDIFAFRTNPADRSQVQVVQVTDLFGLCRAQSDGYFGPGNVSWSNDSNESLTSSYISTHATDIRAGFYVDEQGQNVLDFTRIPDRTPKALQFAITARDIQNAWQAGADLNVRPLDAADLDNFIRRNGGGSNTSPDGLKYVACEGYKVLVRSMADGSQLQQLWDGNAGVQPKYPTNAIWSRDGNSIIIDNADNASYTSAGGYWRMPATGGKPVQLVQEAYKAFKYTSYGSALWSPDSQQISVTYLLEEYTSGGRVVTKDIMRLPVAGGTLINLTADVVSKPNGQRWVSNTIAP